MAQNADLKRYKILEAAKKRFSHFGLAKTTMAEIAQDLSFSKALLYYYYPDKHSLFAAVLEFVFNEFSEKINDIIELNDDIEVTLMKIIESRILSIEEHYSLFEMGHNFRRDVPNELTCIIQNSFEVEVNHLKTVLQKGIDKGELAMDNVEEVAKLLLYSIYGMRFGVLKDVNWIAFPTPEEFHQILRMQQKMTKIFIKGLRIN